MLSEKLLLFRISKTWVNQMRLLCHHSLIIIDNVNNVDDVVIAIVFGQLKSLYSLKPRFSSFKNSNGPTGRRVDGPTDRRTDRTDGHDLV